jgi:hypothetical protein
MPPVADQPFLATVALGTRLVVRYRVAGRRGPSGGPLSTDVVGILRSRSPDHIQIDSDKHGRVSVRRADIVAVKVVPHPPQRRSRG